MSHRKAPLPDSMKRHPQLKGVCRWCDRPMLGLNGQPTKGTWHPSCVVAFKLIHWPAVTRAAVLERDNGICARCGTDCEAARRRAPEVLRLDDWLMRAEATARFGPWATHWSNEGGMRWLREQRANQRAHYGFPNGSTWWQHDHIRYLLNGERRHQLLDAGQHPDALHKVPHRERQRGQRPPSVGTLQSRNMRADRATADW